jgi:hypothetical protein
VQQVRPLPLKERYWNQGFYLRRHGNTAYYEILRVFRRWDVSGGWRVPNGPRSRDRLERWLTEYLEARAEYLAQARPRRTKKAREEAEWQWFYTWAYETADKF